ncbi:hypothetical protein V4_1830 [Lactococcus cremoris]|nr:hypothetical protein V4_1830 [Lactococcus cremoris]
MKQATVNTKIGPKPAINTGKLAQETPVDYDAAVLISGAIPHINQVILLGLTRPRMLATR